MCLSCRSRKMLQNEYLVAKFGFDTAKNEPRQVLRGAYSASQDFGPYSFSAVWTATIVRLASFCSIFRDLQSPLRAKKNVHTLFLRPKKRTFGEGRPSQAGWVQVGPWKAGGGYQRLTYGEPWGNLRVTLG